jgi:hypothetical protein
MIKLINFVFFFPILAFAQAKISNYEISQKLDLILEKVAKLELRVVKLESSSVKVKQEVQEVAKSAAEAKQSLEAITQEPEEKKLFLQNLGNQLKTQQTLESGPWTQKSTWNEIRKNLSTLQVRKILGNPTKIKKSINPRIDQLFIYSGDLDADGENDQGSVSFYRNRLVDYKSPFN